MGLNTEPRESREFIHELKFYLAPARAGALRDWVRERLRPDPHGGGDAGDRYQVTSAYLDTAAFDVYRRNGSFARSKYRVRRYDDSDTVFLERKTKRGTRVCKRRSPIAMETLDALWRSRPEPSRAGYWFHRRVLGRALHPICYISYLRLARVGESGSGPIRLTLDENLRAWRAAGAGFEAMPAAAALAHDRLILELKYGSVMPALFKALIAEFAPVPQGISKYRLALPALGLPAPATKPSIPDAKPSMPERQAIDA
jgi:hypothetical protein